jgi:hypothetical protein
MFLTPDELHTLTGYRRAADQRRWLQDRGWVFEGDGHPVVLRAYAESRLGGKPAATSPNFTVLKRTA